MTDERRAQVARIAALEEEERERSLEPAGDLVSLLPILRPDPIVDELAPLGEERTSWWRALLGRAAA